MTRNPPGSGRQCTRFRDQARARATTEPPDAGYDLDERVGWRLWVAGIAADLDRLHSAGRGGERTAWVLLDAFHAFLPLADPGWWRAYPPSRPNAARRRELRRIHKARKRILRHGRERSPAGDLALWVVDAAEAYLWAGDAVGVGRCQRLINAFQGSPESESADLRRLTPVRGWAAAGDSTTAAGEPPGGRAPVATTPGSVSRSRGKEDDV